MLQNTWSPRNTVIIAGLNRCFIAQVHKVAIKVITHSRTIETTWKNKNAVTLKEKNKNNIIEEEDKDKDKDTSKTNNN